MELRLSRKYLKETYTIGTLFVDGEYLCETLEDKVRDLTKELKVYGKTAIPTGEYIVILSRSTRFGRIMPEILDVPLFAGIRMHSGNTAADTEGCPLVGKNKIPGGLIDSAICIDRLMALLFAADQRKERIRIIVTEDEIC